MKLGIFYGVQLPRPWGPDNELTLWHYPPPCSNRRSRVRQPTSGPSVAISSTEDPGLVGKRHVLFGKLCDALPQAIDAHGQVKARLSAGDMSCATPNAHVRLGVTSGKLRDEHLSPGYSPI